MFKILVIDKRETIHSAVKYLLYRYNLDFCRDAEEALSMLNREIYDLILISVPLDYKTSEEYDGLMEWTTKKKTIAMADSVSKECIEEAQFFGVTVCIDKLNICRLPELVEMHLNKAVTKVMERVEDE